MKKIMLVFILIAATATVINSCRKDESNNSDVPGMSTGDQVSATISGIVLDESDNPVAGVSISADGLSATSNQNGIFILQGNVNKNRCVLQFTKAGFLNRIHSLIAKSNNVNYVRIVLTAEPATLNIPSTTGGTVLVNSGGNIVFPANSFVLAGTTTSYNGTVSIIARHISPGTANFGFMIPGGDLAGKDASDNDVSLYSYGMTTATMKGSGGEVLQLAAGTSASITFPIAPGQLGSAPATIPLWYFDETTSLWKEEGTATKVGNNYVGTVAHFSWWNCDYSGSRATISGRVVDCEGIPLANVAVTVNGGMVIMTDQNGYYSNWIPSGIALTFQVLPQGVIVLPSQQENLAPLSAGQVVSVPDLVVPCGARIYGHITNCAGEPVEGTIILYENNVYANSIYSSNGAFNLLAVPNVTYSLTAVSPTGVNTLQVISPAASESLDAGTMQLCSSLNYEQGFTITGNGYAGQQVALATTITSSDSYWSMATGYTIGTFNGTSSEGACNIYLTYHGNSTGTKNLSSNPTEGNFQITLNGTLYHPSYFTMNPFILELTYYGAVGDSIKGNFYGAMKNDGVTQEVLISSGRFAFPRTQDH